MVLLSWLASRIEQNWVFLLVDVLLLHQISQVTLVESRGQSCAFFGSAAMSLLVLAATYFYCPGPLQLAIGEERG